MLKFAAILLIFTISSAQAEVPPVFVQEAETAWNTSTSPKTTSSFNVNAGDILVAISTTENYGTTVSISDSTSLTWTQQQIINFSGYSVTYIWTAQVASTGAMTVTGTNTGAAGRYGLNVLTFRGSLGVGASSTNHATNGAPTLNITTTQANSAIVVINGDWLGLDGSTRTWRTNAGAFTEMTYDYTSGVYTVYGGYHANAGPKGTYAVGLSAPTGQTYSIIALEIKGSRVKHRVLNY
ncbi:MAG: hypothetical protein ACXVB4_04525 [Pseudobdellovibrionaceae bacterium]